MTVNRYQLQKLGNSLIAEARKVFGAPEYAPYFRVISVSRIQNSKGEDESLKVELHLPGNPKATDTKHISVIGYSEANRHNWPIMLKHEAETSKKKMRMIGSRSREVKDLENI